jgi:RNA polymerase sigma-70 factor (subfamily 1)
VATEDELLQQACAGDDDALGRLLELHTPELRRVIARKLSARFQSLLSEEDVMQQTFTDAFLDIGRFKPGPGSVFFAWLTTLATRNLQDAIRMLEADKRGGRMRRVTPGGSDESYAGLMEKLGGPTTTPSGRAARDEARAALDDAISKLPDHYRRVVQMYDLEERPLAEVAAALERSHGATAIMRHRAIRMLGEIMGTGSQYLGGR